MEAGGLVDCLSADPAGEKLRRRYFMQRRIECPLPGRSSGCGYAFRSKAAGKYGFVDGADQPGIGRGRHGCRLTPAMPRSKPGRTEFYFDKDDLLSLSLQLFSANKIDLAIEVLGLNIHVYPEYIGVIY